MVTVLIPAALSRRPEPATRDSGPRARQSVEAEPAARSGGGGGLQQLAEANHIDGQGIAYRVE